MPLNTQADVFISTLTELVEAERERQADHLRLRHKANADRFMQPSDLASSTDETNEAALSR